MAPGIELLGKTSSIVAFSEAFIDFLSQIPK